MNKKGFTLIELLIVVVIIGILAAIAIPRFGETRERAFRSSIVSDLRNVQTLQEQYYFDSAPAYTYAGDIASIGFTPTEGVSIAISNASTTGFTATGTHNATGTARSCVMTVTTGGTGTLDCSGFDGS